MKKSIFILPAIAAMVLTTSCSSDDEVVLVSEGNINISGQYVTYMHGYQGWIAEDVIGVFVSSKDAEQANLKYTPSEVCPLVENEWVPGIFTYDRDKYVDGQTILNTDTPAEFYGGTHGIYAYVPYAEGNKNYKEVSLPSQILQELPLENTFCPRKEYCFAYAKASLASYSTAVTPLEFETPFTQMTFSPNLSKDMVGKKVTKITVSAPVDIAADKATIDLSTGEISGSLSKSVEINIPSSGLEIEGGYFVSMPTQYLSLLIDFEKALETEFTFTFTIDGKEYKITSKPNSTMSMDGNINMYNCLSIE